jgi:hypothetical protein
LGQTNVPVGLHARAIAAGGFFSLAITADGGVVAWGTNVSGAEPNPPLDLSNVVAIAAGIDHCLALRPDGSVEAWGDNSYGQTNVPSGLSNVVAIAAGGAASLAFSRRRVCPCSQIRWHDCWMERRIQQLWAEHSPARFAKRDWTCRRLRPQLSVGFYTAPAAEHYGRRRKSRCVMADEPERVHTAEGSGTGLKCLG